MAHTTSGTQTFAGKAFAAFYATQTRRAAKLKSPGNDFLKAAVTTPVKTAGSAVSSNHDRTALHRKALALLNFTQKATTPTPAYPKEKIVMDAGSFERFVASHLWEVKPGSSLPAIGKIADHLQAGAPAPKMLTELDKLGSLGKAFHQMITVRQNFVGTSVHGASLIKDANATNTAKMQSPLQKIVRQAINDMLAESICNPLNNLVPGLPLGDIAKLFLTGGDNLVSDAAPVEQAVKQRFKPNWPKRVGRSHRNLAHA